MTPIDSTSRFSVPCLGTQELGSPNAVRLSQSIPNERRKLLALLSPGPGKIGRLYEDRLEIVSTVSGDTIYSISRGFSEPTEVAILGNGNIAVRGGGVEILNPQTKQCVHHFQDPTKLATHVAACGDNDIAIAWENIRTRENTVGIYDSTTGQTVYTKQLSDEVQNIVSPWFGNTGISVKVKDIVPLGYGNIAVITPQTLFIDNYLQKKNRSQLPLPGCEPGLLSLVRVVPIDERRFGLVLHSCCRGPDSIGGFKRPSIHEFKIIDIDTSNVVRAFNLPEMVSRIIYLGNERFAAISEYDTRRSVFTLSGEQLEVLIDRREKEPWNSRLGVTCISLLDDGRIALGIEDGSIEIWSYTPPSPKV